MTVQEWMDRFEAALTVAPSRRLSLLDELASHFADALAAGEAATEVTRAAGAPEEVAEECSRQDGLLAVERALWRLAAGVAALGLYWLLGWWVYPLGQWQSPPRVLHAPHHLGLSAWAGVGVIGVAAILALRSRRLARHHSRVAQVATVLLCAGLALHLGAGNLYIWLRNGIVAGSPSPPAQSLLTAVHLALGGLAVLPLVAAARRLSRGLRKEAPRRSRR